MDVDVKNNVLYTLKREFSFLHAENLIDFSDVAEDKLKVFGRVYRLQTFDKIKIKDIKEVIGKYADTKDDTSYFILVDKVSQNVTRVLRNHNINYCDSNANMFINIGGIKITRDAGDFPNPEQPTLNLNTYASLKVILCLLQNKDSINWPMRKVADYAGVSLGSVQRVFETLKQNAIIFVTSSGKFFKNKKKLLDIWVEGYNSIILPKIFLGKAIFRNPQARSSWMQTNLKDDAMWGGESAAQLYDGYLSAEDLSIFTGEDLRTVVKDLNLIPVVQSGYISVLKKFWNDKVITHGIGQSNLAPIMVVYAQLMGSNDSRCRDAAKRLIKSMADEELFD